MPFKTLIVSPYVAPNNPDAKIFWPEQMPKDRSWETMERLLWRGSHKYLIRIKKDQAKAMYNLASGCDFVVEIGRWFGGSAYLFAAAGAKRVMSVDIGAQCDPELSEALAKSGFDNVELVTGDSNTVPLPEQPIDLLFIDGDHSYKGCLKDWRRWSPLVKQDGWVIFHDINLGAVAQVCQEASGPEGNLTHDFSLGATGFYRKRF